MSLEVINNIPAQHCIIYINSSRSPSGRAEIGVYSNICDEDIS